MVQQSSHYSVVYLMYSLLKFRIKISSASGPSLFIYCRRIFEWFVQVHACVHYAGLLSIFNEYCPVYAIYKSSNYTYITYIVTNRYQNAFNVFFLIMWQRQSCKRTNFFRTFVHQFQAFLFSFTLGSKYVQYCRNSFVALGSALLFMNYIFFTCTFLHESAIYEVADRLAERVLQYVVYECETKPYEIGSFSQLPIH